MRGPHHNAFEHGLAADERFLAAFEGRKQLNGYQKTPQSLKKPHVHKMILGLNRSNH
jgi:hypothetical protein